MINKLDTEAHEDVRKLVTQDAESQNGKSSQFTFFGYVGASLTQRARREEFVAVPQAAERRGAVRNDCARGTRPVPDDAGTSRALTQSLGFFCILPHDPAKTYIRCEKIPS